MLRGFRGLFHAETFYRQSYGSEVPDSPGCHPICEALRCLTGADDSGYGPVEYPLPHDWTVHSVTDKRAVSTLPLPRVQRRLSALSHLQSHLRVRCRETREATPYRCGASENIMPQLAYDYKFDLRSWVQHLIVARMA